MAPWIGIVTFRKQGVWNTPICGTFPRCERCAINVNFRYGAGLQLYQDQRPAPGGCLRDGPRVPADAAPQGRCSLANIHRDVGVSGTQGRQGWHQFDVRLAGGDTLVVVAIDRIGRTWQDIVRSIYELQDRGIKIRSLAEAEAQWPRYFGPHQNQVPVVLGRHGSQSNLGGRQSRDHGETGSGPQHRQRSGRRDGQPRRRVARANLDTRFARVGITAQIILPNKGFPSKFLARIGYTESVPARARTRDRPAVNGKLQLSYRTICLWAEYRLRPW